MWLYYRPTLKFIWNIKTENSSAYWQKQSTPQSDWTDCMTTNYSLAYFSFAPCRVKIMVVTSRAVISGESYNYPQRVNAACDRIELRASVGCLRRPNTKLISPHRDISFKPKPELNSWWRLQFVISRENSVHYVLDLVNSDIFSSTGL